MAITAVVLGAFLKVLFDKLAYPELMTLARSAGIYSELQKWESTLSQIKAVLVDAGQKHLRDSSVHLWLNKLQHLAYDIDDVLDDLATEAMRRGLNQQSDASTSKVLKFIPNKFHDIKYGRKMSFKLDEITSKLHALVEEKNILGLISNVERSNTTSRPRSEETSLVVESEIVGRERDKEALLGLLLGDESCNQNVSIVSIVGLGGIGKTTLARLLYNEEKVKDHFKLTSWVCVYDEFDVFNISKAIFKDVGGDDRKFETLNQLQVALLEKLSNKRFLIVLDDVWNEDYKEWELLQRPFVAGAAGSKVIVTTRKSMVASVMDSIKAYPLEPLSNDEALSLFAQHALGKQNFDSNPTLKLHGESIVKKCGRLPLALTILGRVLRRKRNEEEWEELLNSDIWNVENGGKILPALRLSYYDLPPHLKLLFAYCCLFPKDYLFEKDEIVLLWMGEGFLLKSRSKSMESLGRDCFEELESRSFFQHSTIDESQYTMHDLISDLAMSVAGEFFFMLDDKIDLHEDNESLEKFHHFSFIRREYGVYRKLKALKRARRLRTFLAMSVTRPYAWQKFFLSNKVLVEVLPQLKFLRVLSLANYSITEVPQSIGNLKHLRYLNFSKTTIRCLPEQICDLFNLQSLLVSGCHELSSLPDSCVKLINLRHLDISDTPITCLPEQIGDLYNLQSLLVSSCHKLSSLPHSCLKLINLLHLDISDTPELNEMPIGVGGLTSLQTLSKVVIGGPTGLKVSDLRDLLHLKGELSIKGLHKVINATHAKEANLMQKKGLRDLELDWSGNATRNAIVEYEVLEALRPSEEMTSLKILYYMGTKFPSWIGDPSFDCLTDLTLCGCRSCTSVPTLGHLRLLKLLFLESMNGLKRLGPELLGPADSCNGIAFQSLEVLRFKDMQGWEEWSSSGAEIDGIVGLYPCLREILIENCPKLDVITIGLIPSLQVLHVEGCSALILRSMVGVSSSIVKLTMHNIKGLTQLRGDVLEHLKSVEYLSISECDELTCLCELEADSYDILMSMQRLEVRSCVNLVSLVERNVKLVIREVEISTCPKLEIYECPNSIEMLLMYNCGSTTSLTFPPMDNLPSTLRVLRLQSCDNLEVNWLLSNFLASLRSLRLEVISNVRLLPEGCLVHLTKLTIWSCENIESIPEKGFGFLPLLCLRYLAVRYCKNMKSIPHEHLQTLTSLERMWILDCPSMDYSFPSGLWPPNLSDLRIGRLKKPIMEWGMQHFPTSLVELELVGRDSGVVTFAAMGEEEENMRRNSSTSSFLLPSSLKYLEIHDFDQLESVRKGMEHLTCLERLEFYKCPKLRDLPETLLPSLSYLEVTGCSLKLMIKCSRRRKGKYWPIISQIPALDINDI